MDLYGEALCGVKCIIEFKGRHTRHTFNTMSRYSERLAKIIKDTGLRGLIQLIRQTVANPWLDYEWIERRIGASFQLRLV